jgi:hypothetical protein
MPVSLCFLEETLKNLGFPEDPRLKNRELHILSLPEQVKEQRNGR